MRITGYRFVFLVSLCFSITATSCSPKTSPSRPSEFSVPGDAPAKIPPDQTEFAWTTIDGESRKIEDVRHNLKDLMKEYGVTGLSVLIKQSKYPRNTDSYLLNIGTENPGAEIPIDSMTVFQADRLGQLILAYIVLQFATYGQFDIDKPLVEYLSESTLTDSPFADLQEDQSLTRLTARMILSHQSGLPISTSVPPERKLRFTAQPGKEFGYSEEAFELLRYVLEKRFNLGLNEIATRLVFKPFNMKRTRFSEKDPKGTEKPLSFYTNTADFLEFIWLVREGNPYLARRFYEPLIINPTISIRSPSISEPQRSGDRPSLPSKLAWCLGWGSYFVRWVDLVCSNFIGQKESGLESFTIINTGAQHETALIAFIITDSTKSFMPVVINEFLGKIETPLAWLGFK